MTPRRSSRRIQSLREKTPEPSSPKPMRGPRSTSKFKKAIKKQEVPEIILTRPSLPAKEEEKLTDDNKSSQVRLSLLISLADVH